uniref:Putative secreted protein n=1 Tax=Ixodes ricinus TaxID=34613 RepID=A0A6B0VEZ7_IXORI
MPTRSLHFVAVAVVVVFVGGKVDDIYLLDSLERRVEALLPGAAVHPLGVAVPVVTCDAEDVALADVHLRGPAGGVVVRRHLAVVLLAAEIVNVIQRLEPLGRVHVRQLHDLVRHAAHLGGEGAGEEVALGEHVDVQDDAPQGLGGVPVAQRRRLGHLAVSVELVVRVLLPRLSQELGVISGKVDASLYTGRLQLQLGEVVIHELHVLLNAVEIGLRPNLVRPPHVHPNHRSLEVHVFLGLGQVLLDFGLWPHEEADRLGDPPEGRVPHQADQSLRKVLGHRQREVLGPWLDAVDDRNFEDVRTIVITRPRGPGPPGLLNAAVADWLEDRLPATGGVAPPLGVEHHGASGAVRHDEAVGGVVDLAPVAAPLVQAAQQALGAAACLGVLQLCKPLLHKVPDCFRLLLAPLLVPVCFPHLVEVDVDRAFIDGDVLHYGIHRLLCFGPQGLAEFLELCPGIVPQLLDAIDDLPPQHLILLGRYATRRCCGCLDGRNHYSWLLDLRLSFGWVFDGIEEGTQLLVLLLERLELGDCPRQPRQHLFVGLPAVEQRPADHQHDQQPHDQHARDQLAHAHRHGDSER